MNHVFSLQKVTPPGMRPDDLIIDANLIRQFDRAGPRYTSYPTADRFVEAFDADAYHRALEGRAPLRGEVVDDIGHYSFLLIIDPSSFDSAPPDPASAPARAV